MKVNGQEQASAENLKVVPLFQHSHEDILLDDPLADLLSEAEIEDEDPVLEASQVKARRIAGEELYPDQSLFILEEQLSDLKKSLSRIRFYLGELEDIIPE